jgi:hexokinase
VRRLSTGIVPRLTPPTPFSLGDVFGLCDIHPVTSRVSPSSDYLADSVDAFLTSTTELEEDLQDTSDLDIDSRTVPLGLTFSFPVEQTALDKGYLLTWTKGIRREERRQQRHRRATPRRV